MASVEIHSWFSTSQHQPVIARLLEGAGNTFKAGTPVEVATAGANAGYLIAWDGATVAAGIEGFVLPAGNNLTTKGTAQTLTIPGGVPNEASAVKIPVGAPVQDGKISVEVANNDTVFFGEVGPSQTAAQTDIGLAYGMSIDTDGHWYVDKTKTGASAVVKIVNIDANVNTTASDARGVYFTVRPASQQGIA